MTEKTCAVLSFSEAQEVLGVSQVFLVQSIQKGRLTPLSGSINKPNSLSFNAEKVIKFSELLTKLKSGGIAAMVDIAGKDKSLF